MIVPACVWCTVSASLEPGAACVVCLAQAEVEDLDAAVGRYHHVRRLEIAMDDAGRVGARHAVGDLDGGKT